MALRPDSSDGLDDVANRFIAELESEVIPKFEKGVMTVKQLRDRAAGEEAELTAHSARLQQEAARFFGLTSADDAVQQIEAIVQQEEGELEEAQRELRQAQEAKEATKKEQYRVKRELEQLAQERERLETQEKEWQELKQQEANRVVGRIMFTKFRRDKNSRCVSLQLDNELRIESVILVPEKENARQSDLRNSFWDKLNNNYKL